MQASRNLKLHAASSALYVSYPTLSTYLPYYTYITFLCQNRAATQRQPPPEYALLLAATSANRFLGLGRAAGGNLGNLSLGNADIVDTVPMPPAIEEAVAAFVAEHHVERAFVKRKRDRADPEKLGRRVLHSDDGKR